MLKWNLEPTDQFADDVNRYQRKKPRELSAVLANLQQLLEVLEAVDQLTMVSCSFFKSEGKGLYRISESGGGKNLAPTRLYLTIRIEGNRVIPLRVLPKGQPKKQSEQIQLLQKTAQAIQ